MTWNSPNHQLAQKENWLRRILSGMVSSLGSQESNIHHMENADIIIKHIREARINLEMANNLIQLKQEERKRKREQDKVSKSK